MLFNFLPGLRFSRLVVFAIRVFLVLLAGGIGFLFLGEGGKSKAR